MSTDEDKALSAEATAVAREIVTSAENLAHAIADPAIKIPGDVARLAIHALEDVVNKLKAAVKAGTGE